MREDRLSLFEKSPGWRRCASSLVLFFAVGLLPLSVRAGAWVHDVNKFYVQTLFSYYQADKVFDRNGEAHTNAILRNPGVPLSGLVPGTFKQYEGTLYVEYGLPFDTELVFQLPFYRIAEQDTEIGSFSTQGIGDMTVGVKALVFQRPWLVLSGEVDVGIPAGNSTAEGAVSGQANQIIPLGDDEWDVAFRVLASRSFDPLPIYVTADVGYRIRTSSGGVGYPDDIPWFVESGYSFYFDRTWVHSLTPTLAFGGVWNPKKMSAQTALVLAASAVAGTSPYQDYVDVQPGLSVGLWKGLSVVTNFSYTMAGHVTGKGWTIRTGLSWEN